MIYLLMVPAMAAAIWAWRLAEASAKRWKSELDAERSRSITWRELYDKKCKELATISELQKMAVTDLLDTRAKLRESIDRCETISNHVDNAEGNLQIMKERLKKYEADEQKRREQKRAGMQRYRANKKTKNKTT